MLGLWATLGAVWAFVAFSRGRRLVTLLSINLTLMSSLLVGLELVARSLREAPFRESWSAPLAEPDTELGTIPRADARVRHRRFPRALGYQMEWDVNYGTEADRSRRVPDRPRTGPILAVFGDSLLFGEGLEDHDTIPNQLQRALPQWRVFNYAVRGHGTAQNYFYLLRVLRDKPDTCLCLLGFIPDHVRRTVVPYSLMASVWAGRHPRVRLAGNRIINLGPAYDTIGPIERLHVDLLAGSLIYSKLSARWRPSPQDWDLVRDLVLAMRDTCETDASGGRFVLLVLPTAESSSSHGEEFLRWRAELHARGVLIVDLWDRFRTVATPQAHTSFFFTDGHPNRAYAALVAAWIAEIVRVNTKSRALDTQARPLAESSAGAQIGDTFVFSARKGAS